MNKKVAVLAGGAANGDYWTGVFHAMQKDYDVYYCCSTGALQGVLFAAGKYQSAIQGYSTVDNKTMYGRFSPYNNDGKINKKSFISRIPLAFIPGRLGLYDLGENIETLVRKYYLIEDHKKLQKSDKKVVIAVKCVDYKKKPTDFVNITPLDYDLAVDYIVASASIPIFAKPRKIFGANYGDGGVNDPIPTEFINKLHMDDEVDIYLTHSLRDEEPILDKVDGLFEYVIRLFEAFMFGNKVKNIQIVKNLNHNNCHLHYSPYNPFNSAHFDPIRMKERINEGRKDAIQNSIVKIKL